MSAVTVVIEGIEYVPISEVESVKDQLAVWRRAASVAHAHLWLSDVDRAVAALRAETGLTADDARTMLGLLREFGPKRGNS